MLPMHHIHHKKRAIAPHKYHYNLLDRIVYFIAFMGPFMTLPQIYDIWILRRPSVNLITWGSGLVFGSIWLFYGVVHKEKPIIFSNIMGMITTGLVVLGTLLLK